MGKLIYSMITSIDGYVADKNGDLEGGDPNEEVYAFINDLEGNVGTMLLGRKMYEILAVWDTFQTDRPGEENFAKNWRAARKIVYSTSLSAVTTANTTIERKFNPEALQKAVSESDKNFSIGGPHLAAEAIKAGIVDEYHQYIVPIIIGGGKYWLPKDVKCKLELIDLRKFENGFVHLQHQYIRSLK
jgi:dihydrofolate reductase